jgi:NAD(P)-dependent dehydrogenase (short-subunit alcohol dehydrogenase family)
MLNSRFRTLGLVLLTISSTAWSGLDPDSPTVLITGANRGIGLEFVQQYAARGWNVVATARKPAKADRLQTLADAHEHVVIEQLDVTDFARIDELATKYTEQTIDILISNAGLTPKDNGKFLSYEGGTVIPW